MSQNLVLRVVSACILIPVVVGFVYLGGWYLGLLMAIVAVLAINEWDVLCGGRGLRAVSAWLQAVILVLTAFFACADLLPLALLCIVAGISAIFLLGSIINIKTTWTIIGIVYLALPLLSLIWIREGTIEGFKSLIWLMGVVWATDIGAILVGRLMGGPRLLSRISPSKTWSGAFGGILFAVIVGIVMAFLYGNTTLVFLVLLSTSVSIVAQIGDFAESAVKRRYGVKDSGWLIPGHGGVLDRIDSMVLVLPVAAFVMLINGGSLFYWR